MMMTHERLDYASPNLPGRGGRSVGQWLILIFAWVVGLGVWIAYLVLIGYLLLRML